MTLAILILLVVCILLPLWFASSIWRLDEPTRLAWLGAVAGKLAFIALIFLLGRWDMAGAWTRLGLAAIVAAAVLMSWRRHLGRPWRAEERRGLRRRHLVRLGSLAVYGALLAYVVAGMLPEETPHELTFPLEGGRFVIAHGGENMLLNHHSDHLAQQYAADITAVGRFGFRARGILPDDPKRYAVFGADVVSPCDGTVERVVDGLPDLDPPRSDPDNPAGNHIVIACDRIEVELAHLRQGSVAVAAGDTVTKGQRIAEVGNSGNTTEPHLHVHAVDPATGIGVPLAFDGVVPVRNRIFPR